MTHLLPALAATAATTFDPPTIQWVALAPVLVVFGAAVIGVLIESLLPRAARAGAQLGVSVVALVTALVLVAMAWVRDGATESSVLVGGSLVMDGPAQAASALILVFALLSILLFGEQRLDPAGDAFTPNGAALPGSKAEAQLAAEGFRTSEVYPLALFAVTGMMLFTAANDLLTLFVTLEAMSLPLYLLAGLARRRRLLSQEAALKYFVLGAFSSGFMLFGSALAYGATGAMTYAGIDMGVTGQVGVEPLLLAAVALIGVGMLFKVGAAPFHSWTPDVYQGAPTPVTAFMAAGVKVAAFVAFARLYFVAFGGLAADWQPMIWGAAALTMVVGTVLALAQTDLKRMLAYSSITHAGFLLAALATATTTGLESMLVYLAAYGFSTIGAFAIVTLVRDPGGEATHLSSWAGVGKRAPFVAGALALFLLAFAGIPLTSGFIAKFSVFGAAGAAGAMPLALVGLAVSAVAAYFYVRVILVMFFTDAEEGAERPTIGIASPLTTGVIAIAMLATLVIGLVPGQLMELMHTAAQFVRG